MALLSILTVTLVLLPRGAPPLFRRAPPLSRGVAPCRMVAEPPTRIPSPLRVYAPQAPVPMVEIRAGGQKSVYQGTLASIRSSYKLSSRDARLLRSPTRQLSPRQGYILFDFGDLRGVLQHDRLILLGADGAAVQALGEEIQQRLALSDVPTEEEAPFEVRVLEAMLEQSYSLLEESLGRLSGLVTETLSALTDGSGDESKREDALGKLLPLRISLNALQARTRRVSTVLEEVLENEDDLRDMCLTLLHNNESAFEVEEDMTEEEEDAVELVETLIDVYDARLDGLLDRIEQLTSNIETTQGVLELTLDNERNRIARLELLLSMAGLSIGTCAAVSGYFGMNLHTGIELVPGYFAFVTGLSILFAGGLFAGCFRRVRSISSQQRRRLGDVQALKNALANVDAVAVLLRGRPALPAGAEPMSKELREILTENGFPWMRDREVQLLASMLRGGGQKVVRAVSNVGDRVDALRDRMAFLRRKEGNGNGGGDDGELGGLAAAGFGPAA